MAYSLPNILSKAREWSTTLGLKRASEGSSSRSDDSTDQTTRPHSMEIHFHNDTSGDDGDETRVRLNPLSCNNLPGGPRDTRQDPDLPTDDDKSAPKPGKENKRKPRHIMQPKGTLEYTVEGRDTLGSIAAKFDTTISEVKKLNKLMTAFVFTGQVIFVPDKNYIPSDPSTPSPQGDEGHEVCEQTDGSSPPSHTPDSKSDTNKLPFPDVALTHMKIPGQAARQKTDGDEEEARRLDKECDERFIKVNVKHITDGQGVVSGVLLVTPNAIMFDPNVSDGLVIEHGADCYGMIAPMDTVISAAMYHDIAAMSLGRKHRREMSEEDTDSGASKPQVYHSKQCPLYSDPADIITEERPPTPDPLPPEQGDGLTRVCSCSHISQTDLKTTNISTDDITSGETVGGSGDVGEVDVEYKISSSPKPGVSEDDNVFISPIPQNPVPKPDIVSTSEPVPRQCSPNPSSPQPSPHNQSNIISRTIGSISSIGSFAGTQIVDFSSGLFTRSQEERGRVKDINEATSASPPRGLFFIGSEVETSAVDIAGQGTQEEVSSEPVKLDVENMVKMDDRPGLFKSIEELELIPRPATLYEDPPLYLCLKIGMPINKKVSKTCPIEAYLKNRRKPEYWFSIPREKVDQLYAFFIQWSPNIYGGEEDIDPKERGFVMLEESDDDEDGVMSSMDVIEGHFHSVSSSTDLNLTRQITKDWELVNVEEVRRRLSVAEVENLPLPDLSEPSIILDASIIRTLCFHLPARAEGYPWCLIYSSEKHGFSLKTLYRTMNGVDSPILLLIRDTNNHVFGSLVSCALKVSDHFYGTGESYLFTFYPEFKKYPWTGVNNFFIKGNQESLSIGAGEGSFGLWLDGDLYHGRTQSCLTYSNQVLSESEDFVLSAVEAWGFL